MSCTPGSPWETAGSGSATSRGRDVGIALVSLVQAVSLKVVMSDLDAVASSSFSTQQAEARSLLAVSRDQAWGGTPSNSRETLVSSTEGLAWARWVHCRKVATVDRGRHRHPASGENAVARRLGTADDEEVLGKERLDVEVGGVQPQRDLQGAGEVGGGDGPRGAPSRCPWRGAKATGNGWVGAVESDPQRRRHEGSILQHQSIRPRRSHGGCPGYGNGGGPERSAAAAEQPRQLS